VVALVFYLQLTVAVFFSYGNQKYVCSKKGFVTLSHETLSHEMERWYTLRNHVLCVRVVCFSTPSSVPFPPWPSPTLPNSRV
jgi:hypothetical protein